MHIKHLFLTLCVTLFCVASSASEDFMLAYYVEIHEQGGKYVLQQHGQHLSLERGIGTPLGRGGRGKFSLSLVSLKEKTGVLRLEIYDDKPGDEVVVTPAYSLDIEFSREGAKGDVVNSKGDIEIDFSYAIAPK